MKNILFAFVFFSTVVNAQYKVKGTLNPVEKYSWVLLYKVEGAKQVFVENTKIEKEGNKGIFQFTLPENAETGAYRVTYDMKQNGYVDFLFNKENIIFSFDPRDSESSITFQNSRENKMYRQFLADISLAQYKVDSLQIAYLKNPTQINEESYKREVVSIAKLQDSYSKAAKGMMAYDFIKATDRYNAKEVAASSTEYLNGVLTHFYDKIDFTNKNLYNSSFLVDRVADYVFYMNYSDNKTQQLKLHKKAVDVSLSKISNLSFKADVIEFLVSQFSALKNVDMVDYIMNTHFDKLPKENQNAEFKTRIIQEIAVAIGRTAPDFSWEEDGRMLSLSSLNDGQNYLLIFYSTECSHCLREVPQVFDFMKNNKSTKVVAFAMETTDETWTNYIKNLPNWHHVLGLKKWENKVARTYQINSTPTYFVLDANKKIIGNPDTAADVKTFISKLK